LAWPESQYGWGRPEGPTCFQGVSRDCSQGVCRNKRREKQRDIHKAQVKDFHEPLSDNWLQLYRNSQVFVFWAVDLGVRKQASCALFMDVGAGSPK